MNRCRRSAGVFVVWSVIGSSCWGVTRSWGWGRCCGLEVGPGLRAVRNLEPDESVEDVEHRAEQVEEAEGEVGSCGDAEHAGDVGAAGVPGHQYRGHGSGVLHGAGQDLWCQPTLGELTAEHPRGKDVGYVLVTGDHVQADPAGVDRRDQRPASPGARHDRQQQTLQEAGVLHDRGERECPQYQPDRGQKARHPAAREQLVDRFDTGVADEPGRHRLIDGLDRGRDRPEARVVHEGLDGVPLRERRQDACEQRRPQDGKERGELQDREDHQQQQRQQVPERDVERLRQRLTSRIRADRGVRVCVQTEEEEDDQADTEGRTRSPEHVAHMLTHAQPTADELGDQDGRLRERRHLVAEVGAADDRSGGDGVVEAHHVGHPDEGDTEGADRGPGAPGHHPHQGTDDGRREVEPRRADQPDPVVDDGRDGPGHVPGADQRADRQQDEDRSDGRGDSTDGRVRDASDGVPVLEGHQAGERRTEEQRHLERAVGGVDPEQDNGQSQQPDQHDNRQHRVQHARRARTRVAVRERRGAGRAGHRAPSALTFQRESAHPALSAHVLTMMMLGTPSPDEQPHDKQYQHQHDQPTSNSTVHHTHLTPERGRRGSARTDRRRHVPGCARTRRRS